MDGRRTWEGVPVESVSPPQSVPGRRTPLGAVGLGGFYMQGGQPPQPQHCYPTDENQPEPGTSFGQRLVAYLQGTMTAAGIVPPPGFDITCLPAAAKLLQPPTFDLGLPVPPDPPS
ncbi:Class E basic helix-loop-helix protein 22 [Operophtera brumata]|uniref:Class E basic helix-loop-helix protein 22 n=1 Tax=Operophtera brumata TaxID=104452 RepID=A0A0L7KUK0_OPEBR|nr:Class E basic helix-loop-helix protein 22 [Operophtera brumata]